MNRPAFRLSSSLAYAGMIAAAVVVFLIVSQIGSSLSAPPAAEPAPSATPARVPSTGSNPLAHVLLALAAVVVVGRALGGLFRAIGQPPVIGEVLAGIAIGPSLLGRIAPDVSAYILPAPAAPFLSVIAQLGVILYMFLVGLDLDVEPLRRRVRAIVATSHASIVAPFVLGSLLSLYLYPRLSSSNVPFASFALFMGVAMSVTAFPVLARILTDRRMQMTELGVIALTCAAADDVTAWCLLAFVVGVVQADAGSAFGVVVLTLLFIAVMLIVVRPAVVRVATRAIAGPPGRDTIARVLAGLLLAALATERIGVHAVFGAFLFGAVIPHNTELARTLTGRLEDLVTILLLPAFFAFTGMRTEIGLLSGLSEWLICGLIVLVATAGKFGGTLVAARATGMDWRRAAGLGVLMNTRGLMELIVLNIGLDLGVISPTLFTMMVLMALVTTIATTPLLALVGGGMLGTPASAARGRERRR